MEILLLLPLAILIFTYSIIYVIPACLKHCRSLECCEDRCDTKEYVHQVPIDPNNPDDPFNDRYV